MRAALLFACVWLLTGCRYIISEPYPAFTIGVISPEKVPARVMQAFTAAHPGAQIVRVETRSFKGKVNAYRIWFRAEDEKTVPAIFDPEGQPLPASGSFPPDAANPRSALDARTALCFHTYARWPGASESERSA